MRVVSHVTIPTARRARRLPIGAELQADGGVHFRVWAPASTTVAVEFDRPGEPPAVHPLAAAADGYFDGFVPDIAAGARYRYRLDDGNAYPDPASRFQPEGPHGPSEVVDASTFPWTDAAWPGLPASGLVVYELHIGTFTAAGTWEAARQELPALATLGVNVLEVMPVADFPGRFGWGYDGVNLFAPTRLYGRPDDARAFVDAAHALGLGVVLDVVYNHLGPDGCWLDRFAPHYFGEAATEWGRAMNFDGPGSAPVREFYLANAHYWIDEYHFDGLRLDATQAIVDRSTPHILTEIVEAVRDAAAPRTTWVVCEHEPQHSEMVRSPADGGVGLDAVWNDDFHHSAEVALTGRREAYFSDYVGSPQELVSTVKHGFLYQGQVSAWQKKPRGTPTRGLRPEAFVAFLENHDQVANTFSGLRLHATSSPSRLRALTALLLLGPWTPMLFQGQEFMASAPFLFFADHEAALAALVRQGRRDFMSQFGSLADADMGDRLADPADIRTFERCRLDQAERETHAAALALHASLLALRREDAAFHAPEPGDIDGAVIGQQAFVIRWFHRAPDGTAADDRLLAVNLGVELDRPVLPQPLTAPPSGHRWAPRWSSQDPLYGGGGTPRVILEIGWRLPAETAVLFAATPDTDPPEGRAPGADGEPGA
jgi:maltooligosyltrehalose trehalohydrolase